MDSRVKIIRECKLVGRGTCSTVDECYTDIDLMHEFDCMGIKSADEALEFALEKEGLTLADTLNTKEGYRVFVEAEDGKGQITTEVVDLEEAKKISEEWLGSDTLPCTWTSENRAISMYGQVLTIEKA